MSAAAVLSLAPLAAAAAGPGEALGGIVGAAAWALRAGPLAGAALLAAGLLALTVALRFPRPLAAAGGAVVGALAGLAARGTLALHLGLSAQASAAVGAALVGAACGLLPPLFPFAAAALPGAILGVHVPIGGRGAFGAAAGGLVAGAAALVFSRPVKAALAGLAGAVLTGGGLLALFGARPLAADLAARPLALVAFALVVGIAGAAFQLAGRGAPPAAPVRPLEGRDG